MITGKTTLIAHLGFPTTTFKSPMIYNPYFEDAGIDAVVMPMTRCRWTCRGWIPARSWARWS